MQMKVCVYTNHSIIPLAGVSMVPLLRCQENCSPSDLDRNYSRSSRNSPRLVLARHPGQTVLPRVYLKEPQQRAVVLVQLPPGVCGVVRTASTRVVSLRFFIGYSSAQARQQGESNICQRELSCTNPQGLWLFTGTWTSEELLASRTYNSVLLTWIEILTAPYHLVSAQGRVWPFICSLPSDFSNHSFLQ